MLVFTQDSKELPILEGRISYMDLLMDPPTSSFDSVTTVYISVLSSANMKLCRYLSQTSMSRGKIHNINSGSDSLFLVPVGKPWAFLQPASLGGWQPKDECDSLLSPVTVAAFPVKLLHQCQMYSLSRKPLYTCWAIRTFQRPGFCLGTLTNDHWLYQWIYFLYYEYFYFILCGHAVFVHISVPEQDPSILPCSVVLWFKYRHASFVLVLFLFYCRSLWDTSLHKAQAE